MKCGEYRDKYYIDRLNMIMEVSENILECHNCDQETSYEINKINSWFVPDSGNTFLIAQNRTRRSSGSACAAGHKYMTAARRLVVISSLRNILKDSLDCRFKNVSLIFIYRTGKCCMLTANKLLFSLAKCTPLELDVFCVKTNVYLSLVFFFWLAKIQIQIEFW